MKIISRRFCKEISNYEKFKGFKNPAFLEQEFPGVTIVQTKEQAYKVLHVLEKYKNRIHSWDTETIDLDIKVESNVNKGNIICA